jgi:adenylate cyclase
MSFRFNAFTLDLERGCLRLGMKSVELRPKSFELLRYLVERSGRLLSKDELLKAIWPNVTVTEDSLTRCISDIRVAIGDREQTIVKTVPRRGYLFAAHVIEEQLNARPASLAIGDSRLIGFGSREQDLPSIAVLPFDNLDRDPSRLYVADGLVEDIITELARFSDLLVVARNSSFQYRSTSIDLRQVAQELRVRYVLEGSLRQSGNRVRITAQLIDPDSGGHVWAERYDRSLDDVFALQAEISRTVAGVLVAHLRRAEMVRAARKPPREWMAYDHYLRAAAALRAYQFSMRLEDIELAECHVRTSLALDPAYARSIALLARAHCSLYVKPGRHYRDQVLLERAIACAQEAISLDPTLPEAYDFSGYALSFNGEHEAAIAAQEQVYALNPNHSSYLFGVVLRRAGEHARAIDAIKSHMRLDPFYDPPAAGWLGLAYGGLHRFADAQPYLEEFVARSPKNRYARAWLAGNYAHMGDIARARAEATHVLRLDPGYRVSAGLIGRMKKPEDEKLALEGLRAAGLPD